LDGAATVRYAGDRTIGCMQDLPPGKLDFSIARIGLGWWKENIGGPLQRPSPPIASSSFPGYRLFVNMCTARQSDLHDKRCLHMRDPNTDTMGSEYTKMQAAPDTCFAAAHFASNNGNSCSTRANRKNRYLTTQNRHTCAKDPAGCFQLRCTSNCLFL
jgi:hypothetical protein